MLNLLRDNPNQKYAVVDGESCNLNLGDLNNKPWNWGILDCQGDKILKTHNILIKWPNGVNVSPGAAKVTKFHPSKLENGLSPEKSLEILDSYIYNKEYLILIHNGLNFDVYLHNIFRKNLGKQTDYSYLYRLIDTNAIARGIKENFPFTGKFNIENNEEFLIYQYKLAGLKKKNLKTNLTTLGKENDIDVDYDNLHDGVKDCELLWMVWNKYIKWKLEI